MSYDSPGTRCAALNGGILDRISDLRAKGIPVGTYEASEGDPKEFNEARVREDFELSWKAWD